MIWTHIFSTRGVTTRSRTFAGQRKKEREGTQLRKGYGRSSRKMLDNATSQDRSLWACRVEAGDILGVERYGWRMDRRGIGCLIEAGCNLFLFHRRRHDKVTDDVRCIFVVKSIIYKSPNRAPWRMIQRTLREEFEATQTHNSWARCRQDSRTDEVLTMNGLVNTDHHEFARQHTQNRTASGTW